MSAVRAFWADETTGAGKLHPKIARYALVLIVLNEIRGAIVAGSIAMQLWG